MATATWSRPTIRTIKESKHIIAFHYFCQTSAGHQILEFKHAFSEELCEKTFGTSEYNKAFQECIDPMQDHVMDCLYHSSDTCHVCQESPATRVMVSTKYLLEAAQPLVKNFTSVVCQSRVCETLASKAMKIATERLDTRMEYMEKSLWPEVVYPLPIESANAHLESIISSGSDAGAHLQTPPESLHEILSSREVEHSGSFRTTQQTAYSGHETKMSSHRRDASIRSMVEAIAMSLKDNNHMSDRSHSRVERRDSLPLPSPQCAEGSTRPLSITKAPSILEDVSNKEQARTSHRSSNVPRITIQEDADEQKGSAHPSSPSIVDSSALDEAVSGLDSVSLKAPQTSPSHPTTVACQSCEVCKRQRPATQPLQSNGLSRTSSNCPTSIVRNATRATARSVDLVEYRDATLHLLSVEAEKRNFLDVTSESSSSSMQDKEGRKGAMARARQFKTAAKKTLTCVSLRKIKSYEILNARSKQVE